MVFVYTVYMPTLQTLYIVLYWYHFVLIATKNIFHEISNKHSLAYSPFSLPQGKNPSVGINQTNGMLLTEMHSVQ